MGRASTRFVEVGQQFGQGRVVEAEVLVLYTAPSGYSRQWRCVRLECSCGALYLAQIGSLFSGKRVSCGCARRRARSPESVDRMHATLEARGKITEHPLYATWSNMKRRCYGQANSQYPNYGGRGIEVHAPWHDSRTFIAWIEQNLGARPAGCTLDRKDNDGNYEPGNVQWSSGPAQNRNRRGYGSSVRYRGKGRWGFRLSVGGFFTEAEALAAQQKAIEMLSKASILR